MGKKIIKNIKVDFDEIISLVPECCDIDLFDLSLCSDEERKSLKDFLPNVRTIVVFGHHIESSIEWMWFPSRAERNHNTCGADLHLKDIVKNVTECINSRNLRCKIIPYPGSSGINFKSLASKTNIGELGDNYLFLHNKWGPWIHLRVMLTEAVIFKRNIEGKKEQICIHCNKCIESCPGKAIGKDYFNGALCDSTQDRMKSEIKIAEGYIWKCEICARICPTGKSPEIIVKS